MMDISDRLRLARERAGFRSARQAAREFHWAYSTYAGHENGNRGIKRPDIDKYAAAFDVDAAWLMTGRESQSMQQTIAFGQGLPNFPSLEEPQGFQEGAIAPLRHGTDAARISIQRTASTLYPMATASSLFEVTRAHPSLSLNAGDILVVDQKSIRNTFDGLMLCQVTDPDLGTGETVIRQMTPHGLIPPYGEPATPPGHDETPMGTILTAIRTIAPIG